MVELLGEEEEVVVECQTDRREEEEHSWTVRQLNQTFPVPAELVNRRGNSSTLRLSKR